MSLETRRASRALLSIYTHSERALTEGNSALGSVLSESFRPLTRFTL